MTHGRSEHAILFILNEVVIVISFVECLRAKIQESLDLVKSRLNRSLIVAGRLPCARNILNDQLLPISRTFVPEFDLLAFVEAE